jgi:K+/H+ antiporter YhaU regulatory subunit KhtT
MTENVLTNATNAAAIPTIIAQECLQRLSSYLSIAKNVTKDSDIVTTSVGTTIQVDKTGAVVANDKTAGVNFTKQNPTLSSVSVTLNKHKEVTIAIDDVTKVVQNQDTQAKYGEDGAIAIAEAVESDLLALHPSITNTVTWNRTSAATIDSSLLLVRKFFTDQKVPRLEQKYFAVDASVYNDLLGQQKYTDMSWRAGPTTSEGPVASGSVLRVYGIEISENQLVPLTGSPGYYHNLAYTKGGLVLASRPLSKPEGFGGAYAVINDTGIGISMRTLFWYNADLGAHQLTLEILYGVAILDTRRILEIESP